MANKENSSGLSPTVVRVMEEFVTAMRIDPDISDEAVERLESLLSKGSVPKASEIESALFDQGEGTKQ